MSDRNKTIWFGIIMFVVLVLASKCSRMINYYPDSDPLPADVRAYYDDQDGCTTGARFC